MTDWVLRPAARQDLADIWRYSASTWGRDKADTYIQSLFSTLDLIGSQPRLARLYTEFTPPLRIHPVRQHLVVYESAAPVDVIRILPARSDWAAVLGQAGTLDPRS